MFFLLKVINNQVVNCQPSSTTFKCRNMQFRHFSMFLSLPAVIDGSCHWNCFPFKNQTVDVVRML